MTADVKAKYRRVPFVDVKKKVEGRAVFTRDTKRRTGMTRQKAVVVQRTTNYYKQAGNHYSARAGITTDN